MPIPIWVLLGFAAWTLFILFTTVGVYRGSRILTGADEQQGGEWYRRAIRAHLYCVENLPVYTAIVVALLATRVTSPILDGLAITILCKDLSELDPLTRGTDKHGRGAWFAFFFVQAICMIAMGILALSQHRGEDNIRVGSKADHEGLCQRRLWLTPDDDMKGRYRSFWTGFAGATLAEARFIPRVRRYLRQLCGEHERGHGQPGTAITSPRPTTRRGCSAHPVSLELHRA
jgi:MAPEG family protein